MRLGDSGDPLKNAVKQGWSHLGSVHGMSENKKPRDGYRKFKSWRLGRKSAKRGEPPTECPYLLTEDMIKLLLQRDRWFRGYESYPKLNRKVHKRIDREQRERRLKEKAERTRRKKRMRSEE